MRGSKAKQLRNKVDGNPLIRARTYHEGPGGAAICMGARRAYRVAKALTTGAHPRPPLF